MLVPNLRGWPSTGKFYCRAQTWRGEEELLLAEWDGPLEPLYPEEDSSPLDGESWFDRSQRETHAMEDKHMANVYDVHLSHGWPAQFDKERCRAALLALEKKKRDEDRRLMDEEKPGAD